MSRTTSLNWLAITIEDIYGCENTRCGECHDVGISDLGLGEVEIFLDGSRHLASHVNISNIEWI